MHNYIRFNFPYLFRKVTRLKDPRPNSGDVSYPLVTKKHVWVPMNRDYKILGTEIRGDLPSDMLNNHAVVFKDDPRNFGFTDMGKELSDSVYLYTNRYKENYDEYFENLRRINDLIVYKDLSSIEFKWKKKYFKI